MGAYESEWERESATDTGREVAAQGERVSRFEEIVCFDNVLIWNRRMRCNVKWGMQLSSTTPKSSKLGVQHVYRCDVNLDVQIE